MLYSMRGALNASNDVSQNWYSSKIGFRKTVIIVVNSVMMGVTILWVVLLLPYILSVTKINNRVLSLVFIHLI
jgi:maltodextrin utilization protein YvdJ